MTSIYESDIFAGLPDRSMHPGGLRLTGRAVRLSELRAGMTAADIGCGAGATAAYLTEAFGLRVTGLDVSAALIKEGQKTFPGLDLICWDGPALPFSSESLDAIFLECSLSVIGGTQNILTECARALKNAGVLILSDVVSKPNIPDAALPTAELLSQQVTEAGFEVCHCEDHTPALKTFVVSLYEMHNSNFDICAFFGNSCLKAPPRLSSLEYKLIISQRV